MRIIFVVCFQYRTGTKRFGWTASKRMEKSHLEPAEGKTRLIQFDRYAKSNQERQGRQAETFDF